MGEWDEKNISEYGLHRSILWLVVTGTMAFMTFHSLGNVIIPIDEHIFQRGRYTTNQDVSGDGKDMDRSWRIRG